MLTKRDLDTVVWLPGGGFPALSNGSDKFTHL